MMQVKHGDKFMRCYISRVVHGIVLTSENIKNKTGKYIIPVKYCPMCGKKL